MVRFRNILAIFAISSAAFILIYHIFMLLLPISSWIQFDKVVPLNSEILTGQKPYFISFFEISKDCTVHYNDVMFCRKTENDEWIYYSEYYSTFYGIDSVKKWKKIWRYRHRIDEPGECYLETNVIVDLPFDVEKVKRVKSPIFKVKEKPCEDSNTSN